MKNYLPTPITHKNKKPNKGENHREAMLIL